MSNNNNNWKRIGGFSRTGTQNFVRTNDAAMGGATFGSTDVSYNTGNLTQRIGNNAGVIFINGDIDMTGGAGVGAPINRIKNVRDPSDNQDVVTKHYIDKVVLTIQQQQQNVGPIGPQGPPGIGDAGQAGSDGSTGPTGVTGPVGPRGATEGVVGPTGANGAMGATGSNGSAGATGVIGPVGSAGSQGIQGIQGIQGSNGTILWLNPDGDSIFNELITDSYKLSVVPIQSSVRTIGPISVSATYGNANKMIPSSRFWNSAPNISTLAVIPSGVWILNLYAAVPSNSDANQVSIYAAIFMITGTNNQPSPDSLIIETKEGGDAGYYPPRAEFLPDHVKYIGRSWETANTPTNTQNVLITTATGIPVTSTAKNLYKLQMPVDFVTMKDVSGNSENVYVQLQIYVKNTKVANQTANILLYYQTNISTLETTYSYLQTTFGAIGSNGPEGKTGPRGSQGSEGSKGETGPYGQTGPVGPTGNTGARGPAGPQGATGPTGPAGQSNSFGPQYSVQYRSNTAPLGANDPMGSFGGTTNFRYDSGGSTANASDASVGTVIMNDLACKSIHSSFYVEDPSITGTSTRPRTFVKGGEPGGSYVVLASGKNTVDGGATNSPGTAADITHGIKLIHNFDVSPPIATINLHNNSKQSGKVGMKFDMVSGDVTAATDQFCVLNSSGRVGVGGISAAEMDAPGQSGLNRALHVRGNVMIGTHPAASQEKTASSAMIILNEPTSAPTTKNYPGMYHRSVTGATTTLGLLDSTGGLGLTSPNFITFQTGTGATQSSSVVIDVSGTVSMTGRSKLTGPVSVGISFAETSSHSSVKSILDISGTTHISSVATSYTDNPRLKLISNSINLTSDIPSLSQSANEISGVNSTESSGFLRLSAQTSANSCIDLTGINTHATGQRYNNSVRIITGGTERMIINGSGNIGVGTSTPGVRLDVVGAASVAAARITSTATTGIAITTTGRVGVNNAAPTVDLDVTGAARMNSGATTSTAITTTGRVGVNNATPSVALDVTGDVKVSSTLTTVGYVGIATASPTAPLDVTGNAILRDSVRVGSSVAPTVALDVTGAVKVSSTLTTVGNVGIATASPTAPLDVTGNAILRDSVRIGSSVAPTVALDVTGAVKVSSTLTTVGYVGIATASPTAPLDVTGNAIMRNNMRIGSSAAPSVTLDITGDVKVSSTLTTVGNVGIATASPTAPLDVTGNAILRNSVRIGSSAAPTVPLDVAGAAKISGNLDMTSNRINNLLDPSSSADAATKSYVDTKTTDMATNASVASVATAASNAQSTANSAVTAAAAAQMKANTVATATAGGQATAAAQYLYPSTNSGAAILTNGIYRLYVAATGNIGIGTTDPKYPIHVDVTTAAASSATSTAGWWWGSGASSITQSGNISSAPAAEIAMKLNGSVWIDRNLNYVGFWQTSDRRIKKNINYNISSECLNIFRKLKCTNYSYVDEREHKTNVYGYIAQDVSTVLPYAVTTQIGFIPSLYSLAKISREDGLVKITCSEQKPYIFHSLHDKDGTAFVTDKNEPASDKDGGRHFKVKLFDVSMNEFIVKITQIVDNGVFTIDNDEISVKLTDTEYFVFGQEVDDYKILNNEAITVVATAVLQEVDRQQQADKVRIAELEARVAEQQSLINDILERLKKVGA